MYSLIKSAQIVSSSSTVEIEALGHSNGSEKPASCLSISIALRSRENAPTRPISTKSAHSCKRLAFLPFTFAGDDHATEHPGVVA